ncbi:bacterial peptide chain release factor 1 (bRF-1) [Desulfitobacterium dichloroeliminans LMG P-21439]|uniref:Peptide chain release factor 1 n=1 Tax=Desulfitobacterium dichloroeliminans (strain LMG P-21439 / DCA1) TaxID=871963 RepID=L0FD14_DESDL|nr:peptide chain release factor 1 [Desulfitobacterium dichloroeliminans]AGA70843.1 bacterial peptide chain release factor 1 (bRF-1) [Desulfitobacterium dichloroeliminans LMG P-21439]
MQNKLVEIERRYDELTQLLSDPEVIARQEEWQKYAKAQSGMTDIVETFREYSTVVKNLEETQSLLQEKLDPEFKEMAELELEELTEKRDVLAEEMRVLLLPKDPNDDKNVIMEIRAGAGGEEAALFAGDLYRMYTKYAEGQGWRTELLSASYTDIGGFKEIIFLVEGQGAYSKLKFESGVHRVQRVPATESGGRIHTSTTTVAVLPEAEDVDVQINPNDLRIDIFCSSGPGGQSVNTTQSAVRITHIPTGTVVSCQDEKSQLKNKEKALRVLRARVLERAQEEAVGELASERRSQVGTGDRSERIRTYNFPQGRVTDHRIGLTLHRLDAILLGELDDVINALITTDQAERLKAEA